MYQQDEIIDKIPKINYIFYGAFLLAPLLYLFIANQMATGDNPPIPNADNIIFWIFPFVALAVAIGGVFFRKFIQKRMPLIKSSDSFESDFIKNAHIPMIIYLSIFESISIYGFITFIMGGQMMHFIFYVIASMALMIYFRPSRQFFLELLEHQRKLVDEGKFMKKSRFF